MIVIGDCLDVLRDLPDGCARMCVTSPPYWGHRDYGCAGQLGLEKTPDEFVDKLVDVFRDVRRALSDDGTLWLNLGDSYAAGGRGGGGSYMQERKNAAWQSQGTASGYRMPPPGFKMKDLVGIPWMVAFALRADGWYLRQEIIWAKPNPMPESVTDRCTKSHEHIFLLSKSKRYYWDTEAAKEPAATKGCGEMRNRRDVWTISTSAFKGAHFATFPPDLIEPCIIIGSAPGDVVIDPFCGAGTTGLVAKRHGRDFLGIELNPEYAKIAEERIALG